MIGADTRLFFTVVMVLVVVERGVELALSIRNGRRARRRGGVEAGVAHYRWMVGVHTAFLASCLAEVWLRKPPFFPALALTMLAVSAAAMALRYWAITTLGERWNTRVIAVPGDAVVSGGPYRFMRHPNYVAVAVEIVSLPLIHTAWRTALVFGVANLILLRGRVRIEESMLSTASDYATVFADRRRFLPGRRGGE
ncbi:MAG: isoprenylcysteine carboxyl methyltransferase family protein [Acidobacteriota bacterium]